MKNIFFIILILSSYCKAEDFSPALNGLTESQKKIFGYIELEENYIKISTPNLDDNAWKKLTRLYERYVELFCYENKANDFNNKNPNTTKTCKYFLNKLFNFHEENPLAICGLYGLKSKKCSDAYLKQYIAREEEFIKKNSEFLTLEIKLYEKEQKIDLNKLKSAFASAEDKFNKKQNSETWTTLKRGYDLWIDYYCSTPQISYNDFTPPEFMQGKNLLEHQKYSGDKLYELVYQYQLDPNRLGNLYDQGYFDIDKNSQITEDDTYMPFEKRNDDKNKNDFKPKPFWRVRSISKDCFDSILQGLKFNPYLPSAICALHGPYSNLCLDANENFSSHLPHYVTNPPKEIDNFTIVKF